MFGLWWNVLDWCLIPTTLEKMCGQMGKNCQTWTRKFRYVLYFDFTNFFFGPSINGVTRLSRGWGDLPKHTRVEPVGRVAKMNWLNYDMGMKIHAICDTKNAILKYFSLDMWKFTQIWAFFFLYREF